MKRAAAVALALLFVIRTTLGASRATEPMSTFGEYRLRGITEVGEAFPIVRLVERGWPDYAFLPPPADPMFVNYRAFLEAQRREGGLTVLGAEPGSTTQIVQVRKPDPQASFSVRIVAANNRVWTGEGHATRTRFPPLDTIQIPEDRPSENMCSVALRISYGRFDYFTGGDMPGYPVPGAPAWHDLETDAARAIGPTDVHVVNHHGSLEEENLS